MWYYTNQHINAKNFYSDISIEYNNKEQANYTNNKH